MKTINKPFLKTCDEIINDVWQVEHPEASCNAAPTFTRFIKGIGDLANHYDAFLVDQWGVLHNGHAPYPGVVQCLKRLAWAGKQVIIISNSGKRSDGNEARMKKLGFPRSSYKHLVTSGEIAWQMLETGSGVIGEFHRAPCLLLTSDPSDTFAQGLTVPFVESIEQAGLILLAGIDDSRSSSFYEDIIEEGVARKLPLVCTNPDLTRITANGLQPSAGAIAQTYQERGGKVHFIGKPYPEIYQYCDLGTECACFQDSCRWRLAPSRYRRRNVSGVEHAFDPERGACGSFHRYDRSVGNQSTHWKSFWSKRCAP